LSLCCNDIKDENSKNEEIENGLPQHPMV